VCLVSGPGDSWLSAEDRVLVKAKSGRETTTSRGEIVDYTGVSLVLRRPGGREEVIEADRVLQVDTPLTAAHRTGDEQFASRQFEEALSSYRTAVGDEKRTWVQRQLLAQIVWCLRAVGRTESAIDVFLQILRSDPATHYYSAIPVSWFTEPPSLALEQKAKGLLADRSLPDERLIAASWLLPTAQRNSAIATLQGLLNADDSRVAFLAEAQLWRTQVATASPEVIARWRERWTRIPDGLQPGPAFVLGQAYSRRNQPEESALLFLRAPILQPRDRGLASQALLAAGRELETMKQVTEAATIYREILAEHGTSAAAPAAQHRLSQLSPSNATEAQKK
jgi:tetratricopeptide (TPR) repeat protein